MNSLSAASGSDQLIERVVGCLRKCNPIKIILFGSYARGDADEYSDIDIVLIKESSKRFMERLIDAARLVDVPSVKADVFVYTPEEWRIMLDSGSSFAHEALAGGKVLYEAK